jgi:hypothetical protein
MNDVQVIIREIRFPCVPWVQDGPESLQPVRGTWTLVPEALWNKGVHGVLSCPHCGKAALIPHEMGETIEKGARRLNQLRCECGFTCHAILEDWDLRKLFCVAWESYDSNGKVIPQKDYMHATSSEEAIFFFEQSHIGMRYHIVGAAPVIGYFARSEKNEKDLRV